VLLDALNRHRGKGQQKVTVEHAPGVEMPCPNAERSTVPVTSNAERPLPNARRKVAGRPEG
jgi:hypothetical protein